MLMRQRHDPLKAYATFVKSQLDAPVRRLITLASCDLYDGTSCFDEDDWDDYPGFSEACRRIRDALDEAIPSDVYLDEGGDFIADNEDACEDFAPFVYHFDRRDVRRALLGALAEYL